MVEWRDHWRRAAALVDQIISRCDSDPEYGAYVESRLKVVRVDSAVRNGDILSPAEWEESVSELSDSILRYKSDLLKRSATEKLADLGFRNPADAVTYVQARKNQAPGGTP